MAAPRRRSTAPPTTSDTPSKAAAAEAPSLPVHCYAIDDIAWAALREPLEDLPTCNTCGESLFGKPMTSGLLMWSRGDEIRFDEPPLCGSCATAIGVTALARWRLEEEGM